MSTVTIKHGSKKYKKFSIVSEEEFEDFQARVFSLTQVPPDRQKFILKGKRITDISGLSSLKKKSVLTLMGSAVETVAPSENRPTFLEDMTNEEKQSHSVVMPSGLENLGNTCYLNATLQCLRGVDELKDALKNEAAGGGPMPVTLSPVLGNLMNEMESTGDDAVTPGHFVNFFRQMFPRFATRDEKSGAFQQQDAGECLTEILNVIRTETRNSSGNVIDRLFEGRFDDSLKCEESGEETLSTSTFHTLRCFIDQQTRHVVNGCLKGMSEDIEKPSAALGRVSLWHKASRISSLPKYLTIQIVRFEWKRKTQKSAKILRKIIFPDKLDAYEFCNTELKAIIGSYRRKKVEYEDAEREKRFAAETANDDNNATQATNNASTSATASASAAASTSASASSSSGASAQSNANSSAMDVDSTAEQKDNAAIAEYMDVELTSENAVTGYYELFALVTHKGLSANSGHYIGYAKDSKRGWLKYDDDYVTEVSNDDIKSLYGGGQFQMGYVCFYRRVEYDTNVISNSNVISS